MDSVQADDHPPRYLFLLLILQLCQLETVSTRGVTR
jgi:hypothetical protein